MQKNHFKIIILISLFTLTRFLNLQTAPPFVDELLYIRWTRTIANNFLELLLPVIEDGQPPLYFWLSSLLAKLTEFDPLLILRLISISFGAATIFVLVKFGTLIHSRKLGYILGLIYTIYPMFLWYDKLAMRESMITFSGTLLVYGLHIRFRENAIKSGSILILAGLFLGLLTKGTALLFIPVILACYLVAFSRKNLFPHDYFLLSFIILTILIGLVYAKSIFLKSESFLLDLSSIFSHLYINLYSTLRWLIEYSTAPLILLWGWGALKLWSNNRSLLLYSLGIFTLTVGIEIVIAKIYFPRYFLWVMPFFMLPIAWGILELSTSMLGKLVVALSLLPLIHFDFLLIINPLSSPLPAIERWQYQTGWPSGYGISELVSVIQTHSSDYIIVEKNEACRSGLIYHGAILPPLVELSDISSIKHALNEGKSLNLCLAKDYPPSNFRVNLIREIMRPGGESSLRLYQLESLYE